LIRTAVGIARWTRGHPRFRKGASVRAAASIVSIAERLGGADAAQDGVMKSAALAALATRVELRDEEGADLGAVIDEILEGVKKN
jgi:hypothetical protein